ncbi:MAG: hypothetical protein U0795_19370 [Pirellulales bacterium]
MDRRRTSVRLRTIFLSIAILGLVLAFGVPVAKWLYEDYHRHDAWAAMTQGMELPRLEYVEFTAIGQRHLFSRDPVVLRELQTALSRPKPTVIAQLVPGPWFDLRIQLADGRMVLGSMRWNPQSIVMNSPVHGDFAPVATVDISRSNELMKVWDELGDPDLWPSLESRNAAVWSYQVR